MVQLDEKWERRYEELYGKPAVAEEEVTEPPVPRWTRTLKVLYAGGVAVVLAIFGLGALGAVMAAFNEVAKRF